MIDFIRGVIKEAHDHFLVVEVSGMGIALQVPRPDFMVGSTCEVRTYLHWNAEQGPSLYGFKDEADRIAFCLIISCQGIGPKLGLAVLKQLSAQAFFSAIIAGDNKVLSSVSGVGTKKAEALIMHLKDKVSKLLQDGTIKNVSKKASHLADVSMALGSLHYTRPEVQRALEVLQKQDSLETATFEELMRKALVVLAQK